MNIKNLEFHIKSDDLFGTLATILSLIRETKQPIHKNLIDNLVFLQDNYKIVKKK